MKHLSSLLAACTLSLAASAQVSLNGTSYTQNFSSLASGLPTGWSVYTGATPTMAGTDVSATKYTATPVRWNTITGGFRNSASANAFTLATYSADSATQAAVSDRALAVRQVGATSTTFPGSDSGAAFVLKIANTNGLTGFAMNFKLQSLDTSSPRTTTWTVDYGTGATPSAFTNANATGTLTTGNKTFSNNTINVSFGSALNNQTGPVWIRIAALTTSTGAGNRPTSGIDDVNLTWTGGATSIASASASSLPVSVLGRATTNRILVGFSAAKNEQYTLAVYDLNGREVARETVTATAGANQVSLAPRAITAGQYILHVSNGSSFGTAKVVVE